MSRTTNDDLEAYITNFQARVLHDAMLEATTTYWERRARAFEAALPRRGDHIGNATLADVNALAQRVTEQAQACRNRAALVDATRAEILETVTDLAAGAAA